MAEAAPDPFAGIDSAIATQKNAAAATPGAITDPFTGIDSALAGGADQPQTSGLGAFLSHAALGAVPAGAATIGAGAAAGAATGLELGPWGAVAGGVIGGGLAAYGAGKAQEYAINAAPANWKDPLEQTLQAQEQEHPTASFLGGMLPYALTMNPLGAGRGAAEALGPNSTALQRIMANPATARLFGGGFVGGLELGQEEARGERPNWTNVGIATGFGILFPQQNKWLGERLTKIGEAPFLTVNQAKASGALGTEDAFKGDASEDPYVFQANQQALRDEQAVLGTGEPESKPDIHAIVRQSHPDLINAADALDAQSDALRTQINRILNPPDEDFAALDKRHAELDTLLSTEKNLDEQRRLRTRIRLEVGEPYADLQARREAFANGEAQDTPESAQLRKQLIAVDAQRRDIGYQIGAAYRSHAENGRAEVVTPPAPPIEETAAAVTAGAPHPPEAAPPPSVIQPPRVKLPPSPINDNINTSRDISDRSGLTAEIESAASTSLTADGITRKLIDRLPGNDFSDKLQFVREVRASLGVPSQAEPAEFQAWLAEYGKRQAANLQAKITASNAARAAPPPVHIGAEGAKEAAAALPAIPRLPVNPPQMAPTTAPIEAAKPLAEQKAFIANDFKQQAITAGWDTDTAEVFGHFAANFFGQRAVRFNGALGSTEDLYREQGAQLLAGEAPIEKTKTAAISAEAARAKATRMGVAKMIDALASQEPPVSARQIFGTIPRGTLSREEVEAMIAPPAAPELVQRTATEKEYKGGWTPSKVRNIIYRYATGDASTLFHEYAGHEFFDRLMSDAMHPLAPDDLKDDAQSIIDELNKIRGKRQVVALGEKIPDWAHEQVARWAEQYAYLGSVPSERLIPFFERLKASMRAIYKTVQDILRKGQKPMPEAFRQVWDKLLAETPEPKVIAPERPRGPTLADVHAADASETPVGEAAIPVMVNAKAEITQHEADLKPEVKNVLTPVVARIEAENAATAEAGPTSGNRPGEGQEPNLPAGGGGPEPNAGGGGHGAGAEPELGRGGATGPEGAGVRAGTGETTRTAAGPVSGETSRFGPVPIPPRTIPEPERFIDKAGNIRLDTINAALIAKAGSVEQAEVVKQIIRDIAKANNNFIGDRRGAMTNAQRQDLADALGVDASYLSTRKIGQAYNAEEAWGAREFFVQLSTDVGIKAKAANQARLSGDAAAYDKLRADYVESAEILKAVQGQIAGITAEAGRTLNAFKTMPGWREAKTISDVLGRTLYQIDEEISLVSAIDKASVIGSDASGRKGGMLAKRSIGAGAFEVFVNNLVSNPATHATYGFAKKLFDAVRNTLEYPTAALIGAARAQRGREGERVVFGEAGARLHADLQSQAVAMKYAALSFKAGVSARLPGETKLQGTPFQPGAAAALAPKFEGEIISAREGAASVAGVFSSILDSIKVGGALLKAGGIEGEPTWALRFSPLGVNPDIAYKGVGVLPLGTLARGPTRTIAGMHTYMRVNSQVMSISGQAIRKATLESEALAKTGQYKTDEGGLRTGPQRHYDAAEFSARVEELRRNPTEEMMQRANAESTSDALMEQTGAVAAKLAQFINIRTNLPILGETQPFKFIDPFVHISSNILRQSLRDRTVLGLLSSEIRAQLRGDYGNVTADMAAAKMVVGSLIAIGFGALAANGYARGSGSADPRMRAVEWAAGLQPHSIRIGDMWYSINRLGVMGMLVSLSADLYDVAGKAEKGDMLAAGAALMHAFTQNILDESWMRGPADLIQAVEDPGRYGEGYIRNFFSSFIPYSMGLAQMDRDMDPYMRQVRTVADAMRAKIPGLSEGLMPRRDIWGQPLPNRSSLIPGITSIWEQRMGRDPVNLALLTLGIAPAMLHRTILGVELDDQQYDDYLRVAGVTTKERLDRIVNSPQFQSWPGHTRHDVIKETIHQSREAARGWMRMRYPDIAVKAYKQKTDMMAQEDEDVVDVGQ